MTYESMYLGVYYGLIFVGILFLIATVVSTRTKDGQRFTWMLAVGSLASIITAIVVNTKVLQ